MFDAILDFLLICFMQAPSDETIGSAINAKRTARTSYHLAGGKHRKVKKKSRSFVDIHLNAR